jgi:sec-independent protein translocase protein TatA
MIGLDNPFHLLIVLLVVLMVFGARRLPEMGRSLGEGLRGFKDGISGEQPAPGVDQVTVAGAPPSGLPDLAPDRAAARHGG